MAKAAQLLETMRSENPRTNDVRNQSGVQSAVVPLSSSAQQSLREQSKQQPSKMFAIDLIQSLFNVLQDYADESLEIKSIPSNCVPSSEPSVTAPMFLLASTFFNRELFFTSVQF